MRQHASAYVEPRALAAQVSSACSSSILLLHITTDINSALQMRVLKRKEQRILECEFTTDITTAFYY